MSDSQSTSSSSDDAEFASMPSTERDATASPAVPEQLRRHWRDVFWLAIFAIHLIGLGFVLAVLGINRFEKADRLKIDKYTYRFVENESELTETYWPFYAVAAGVGSVIGWVWLALLGSKAMKMMKFSVHVLTTYLGVISVLCFWGTQVFWGVAFAIGAALQLLYVISVVDRLPFTMLVLQKAVKMVWNLPEVLRVACAFMVIMLLWMAIWSFGAAGVVASSIGDGGRWWLLAMLSVSLFWTGAVLCNTVHVIVSGMVFLVLIHGGREAASMPPKPLLNSLRYALTTSFGSICYGSLFTAAIRTLRWEIAAHGKGFNHSARDAWELFQSTGVEALVAYDCSGAVLLMGTILGGLITGTCAGVWTWLRTKDRVIMVGFTAMLMGMILVGLAMVVVESAVTSIYICYAEDPSLINRWDAEFFNQMSEALHQRLQHRSARTRVTTQNQFDSQLQISVSM
ncbi:hypothetical protein Syun_022953 [Stephania yunnanensis]|uniref:Choline transporter-like protein n=1 Tax=Stephania yunnanensis TaxID=152371 RepID=A0AAP0FAQ9_9MAGN